MDWAIEHSKGGSVSASVYEKALSASVYYILGERNSRLFQKQSLDNLALKIEWDIQFCTAYWRKVARFELNKRIGEAWGMPRSLCNNA